MEPGGATPRSARAQSHARQNTPTVMTFTDSNQEDMLQSLVHSEGPAREEQRGGGAAIAPHGARPPLQKSVLFHRIINKHEQRRCGKYLPKVFFFFSLAEQQLLGRIKTNRHASQCFSSSSPEGEENLICTLNLALMCLKGEQRCQACRQTHQHVIKSFGIYPPRAHPSLTKSFPGDSGEE